MHPTGQRVRVFTESTVFQETSLKTYTKWCFIGALAASAVILIAVRLIGPVPAL